MLSSDSSTIGGLAAFRLRASLERGVERRRFGVRSTFVLCALRFGVALRCAGCGVRLATGCGGSSCAVASSSDTAITVASAAAAAAVAAFSLLSSAVRFIFGVAAAGELVAESLRLRVNSVAGRSSSASGFASVSESSSIVMAEALRENFDAGAAAAATAALSAVDGDTIDDDDDGDDDDAGGGGGGCDGFVGVAAAAAAAVSVLNGKRA